MYIHFSWDPIITTVIPSHIFLHPSHPFYLQTNKQEPGTYPGAPGADTASPLGNDDVLSMDKAAEYEVIHGRWAMLAIPGIVAQVRPRTFLFSPPHKKNLYLRQPNEMGK